MQRLRDLDRELAGWDDDQRLGFQRALDQVLHYREAVRRGFPGAGRGLNRDIPPCQEERNRARLDRGRRLVAQGGDRAQSHGAEAQLFELD